MLGVNTLIQKLNTIIAGGGLSNLQVTELSKAIDTLEKNGVSSVAAFIELPDPSKNTGRFFWVELENQYVVSNGVSWSNTNILTLAKVNLYSWGTSTGGLLGDNTVIDKSSPVSIAGRLIDWIDTSSGDSHALAIRGNGTMWAWGSSASGQLGDNTVAAKSSPVSVVGGFTDWIQVSAGGSHSLGLRANGIAYAWGVATNGRLGDNQAATNRSSPVSVVGGILDWIQVSAGQSHSLGLRENGTLYAWGSNVNGRLGDNVGATTARSSPVLVAGSFVDWVQASAGQLHSLAVRANGTLYGWGYNVSGRIGDGTTVSKSSPTLVVGGFTDWTQASAGNIHSLGLRANGTLYAWGAATGGVLGDNTTVFKNSPVSVVGGFTDWVQISAGKGAAAHSLGLRANGTAWAWGDGANGKLGDNTAANKSSPVLVAGGLTDWVQVSAGAGVSAGIRG